jgi:hypothetical protein
MELPEEQAYRAHKEIIEYEAARVAKAARLQEAQEALASGGSDFEGLLDGPADHPGYVERRYEPQSQAGYKGVADRDRT